MNAATENKWPTVTREHPCPKCGKTERCTVTPDGSRGRCWRSGGTWSNATANGHAMQTRPALTPKAKSSAKTYASLDEAVTSERLKMKGASVGGQWNYDGKLVIQRFDIPGGKQIRPFHPLDDGRWRCGDPPGLLPLYRINEVPQDATLSIAEGEKCVDVLWSIGLPATTNSHGALQASRTDWKPAAKFARVNIFVDADEPGRKYGESVARLIAAHNPKCEIRIIELRGNDGTPSGFDVADWIEERDTLDDADLRGQLSALTDATEVWTNADSLTPVSLAEILRDNPAPRPVVIQWLARVGQVANLISTSKSYKTYLIICLAIAMARGKAWLDTFQTCGGRVLIIDMELQMGDFANRIAAIARAMFIDSAEIMDRIDVLSLRGRNVTIEEIEPRLLAIKPGEYSLIILDPLYKLYPASFDENSNAQMTSLYRRFERIAENAGAALMIVHHASKGGQSDKRVTDVGSGAGAQSRSPDAHIALREHEAEGCVVFDCKVRSFPPNEPIVLRWEYPLWKRDSTLDPTQLKTGRTARNKPVTEPVPAEPPPEPWTVERFATAFLSDAPQGKATIITKANIAGVSSRLAEQLFRATVESGKAFEWTYASDNRKKSYANFAQPLQEVTQ